MTAVDFIQQLTLEELQGMDAKRAHGYYATVVGGFENAGTYGYFRTKYNNHLKEMLTMTTTERKEVGVTIESDVTPEAALHGDIPTSLMERMVEDKIGETEELPERVTVNYKDGDKLPDVPDLIPTGTVFDRFISDRITTQEEQDAYYEKYGEDMPEEDIEIGGFTRQCVDIVAGPPGSGKTTSRALLGVAAKIFARREQGKELTIHFISGEMRESEWAKELKSCSLLEEIEVTYMLDYVGFPNYEEIFWDAFAYGDYIICDSLPAIISHMKMSTPVGRKSKPETQMIFDFIRKSLQSVQENNNNVQLINQANKDGNYKGGTELPHMMSSMSFVRLDGQNRYMMFEKNRNNGNVRRKLFFNRDPETGGITFNEEAYSAAYEVVSDKKESLSDFIDRLNEQTVETLNKLPEGSITEISSEEMDEISSEEMEDEVVTNEAESVEV